MGPPFRAVVFDLDGVLWDGEPIYHEAFNIVLAPYGRRVTSEDYVHIIGHSVESAWDWVIRHFQLVTPPAELYGAYDDAVLNLLAKPIEALPGARALIRELRRRRIPVGLASASLRQWVEATIRGLGLEDAFDAVVSASEVKHAKPAPDLYLEAARRLGVPPGECLAVEDTGAGIAAAKAAGMFAVQLRAASTALPHLAEADLVIEAYAQFDLRLLSPGHPEPGQEAVQERPLRNQGASRDVSP
ncbi:MAG: HAD family phosphatase [Dehalococcoidia bacterium]|nr:HAD family phosphatase [Dehalococcoidia bacterium]